MDDRSSATTELSAKNPRVQQLRRLCRRRSERAEAQRCVVEGPTLIAELLRAGTTECDTIFVERNAVERSAAGSSRASAADVIDEAYTAGVDVAWLADGVLDRVLDTQSPQGIVATVVRPASELVTSGCIVCLPHVADPGNLGTIMRSAEAAGVAGIALGPGSVDPFAPKVVRASAGSALRMPIYEAADANDLLRTLRDAGVVTIGADAAADETYSDASLDGDIALVLGAEAHGYDAIDADLIDRWVAIPMAASVESLNVAMVATLLSFEAARQRRLAT